MSDNKPESGDNATIQEMRAELEAQRKRIKELEGDNAENTGTLKRQAFQLAGFELDGDGVPTGPARLLWQQYEGQLTGDAVLEAAKGYGLAPTPKAEEVTPDEFEDSLKPEARSVSAAQDMASVIHQATAPPARGRDAQYREALHKAEETQEWGTFIDLELQKQFGNR